jgi:hypothetical protein
MTLGQTDPKRRHRRPNVSINIAQNDYLVSPINAMRTRPSKRSQESIDSRSHNQRYKTTQSFADDVSQRFISNRLLENTQSAIIRDEPQDGFSMRV